jgi:hypothetical protein
MGLEQVYVRVIPRAEKTRNPDAVPATRSRRNGVLGQKKNKGQMIKETVTELGVGQAMEKGLGDHAGGMAWMIQGGSDENR